MFDLLMNGVSCLQVTQPRLRVLFTENIFTYSLAVAVHVALSP